MITIKSFYGEELDGHLALPGSGYGPGIVVLQEIFGINAAMRVTAEHHARAGYAVIVPDLFWRQQPGMQLDADI